MNFKEYKISDLCDVKIGKTPPTSQREWFNPQKDYIDWVSIKDMGDCNKYLYNTCKTLSTLAIEEFNIPIVEKGRVLLSFKLTIGKVAITTKKCLTNEAIAQFIIKDKRVLDNDFLYYYLTNYNFEQLGNTSSIATAINSKIIKTMSIEIPDITIQKKITKLLSALDDRIELNIRISKNLEEQAQALFKSWFVDFEPFGGEMPSDWEKIKLGEIACVGSGKRPPKSDGIIEENDRVPIFGASGVMGYCKDILYNEPILIIGRVGTHGIVQRISKPCWASDNTLVIKSEYYEYVYQILKNIDYSGLNRGSTQPLITQTDIKNTAIILPNIKVLQKYERISKSLLVKTEMHIEENRRLSEIRDTLLPKLMSGEIDVTEIDV